MNIRSCFVLIDTAAV